VILRRARQKFLKKPAPACGAAATKAVEAKKATEAKRAAAEPADVAASRGEAATMTKTAGAEVVGQATGADVTKGATKAETTASAAEATTAKMAAGSVPGKDLEDEPPVVPPSVPKG
jgi:hypothetical protein